MAHLSRVIRYSFRGICIAFCLLGILLGGTLAINRHCRIQFLETWAHYGAMIAPLNVDPIPFLGDQDGVLRNIYSSDVVHLKAAAYEVIGEQIAEYISRE